MGLEEKISYGDLLRLTSVIILPLFLWGVSVEKRQAVTDLKVSELKREIKEVKGLTKEINDKLDKIIRDLYVLKSKK
jgi:hypothetical protein